MKYKRKVVKYGASLCVNIPPDVAKFLKFDYHTPITLTVEDDRLIIQKESDNNGN